NNYFYRANWSNYGKGIDIWAPGCTLLSYQDEDFTDVNELVEGTSFSSPIVAGVIATILSENNDIIFTRDSMMDYLDKIGSHNIISGILEEEQDYGPPTEDEVSLFINNGKRVVYS
ncbi:hypothetical protein BCR36DRAFT_241287, partial [Piromyces finnis]